MKLGPQTQQWLAEKHNKALALATPERAQELITNDDLHTQLIADLMCMQAIAETKSMAMDDLVETFDSVIAFVNMLHHLHVESTKGTTNG